MSLPHEQATCLAETYLESGLSDEAIDNLISGKPLAPVTEDDADAIQTISAKTLSCQ